MIIYTDGACSGNGSANAVGGFGVIVLDDNENLITTHHEQVQNTTNNRMELSAILWTMIKYGKERPAPTVYSDSAYCVNTLTSWMYGWAKRGWVKSDNKEPENLDLIQAFYKLTQQGYTIDLRKCHGHSGDYWNEQADKLAVAAKEGSQQVVIKLLKHINSNERI
jgi:ribonuclease HI